MNTLRTIRKLILGETWLLPAGVAVVVGAAEWIVRPLLGGSWKPLGGLILLVGALTVLTVSVAVGARPRHVATDSSTGCEPL